MANPEIAAILKLHTTQFVGELRKTRSDLNAFGKDVQNIGRFIAAAFVTGALARFAKHVVDVGDELAKLNQKTGLTVEFLNGLTQAGNLAGVSSEQLSVGIRTLNKNLLDAKNGTGEAKDELLRFGVSSREAGELLQQPEQAFIKIVDILSKIPTASERGAVAQKLMGRSGAELLPLLNQGSDALQRQIKELHEHRKITTEQARAAEVFNDQITSLTTAFEGFVQRGVGPLLEPLTRLLEILTDLIALDAEKFQRNMRAFLGGDFNDSDRLKTLEQQKELLTSTIDEMEKRLANGGGKTFFGLLDTGLQNSIDRAKAQLANVNKDIDVILKKQAPKPTIAAEGSPGATIAAQSKASQLDALIKQRQASIELVKAEDERDKLATDRVHILEEEIAKLTELATIQKEIEAAEKGKREINPGVAVAARIQLEADLLKIQNERVQLFEKERAIEEESKGADIVSEAKQQQILKLRDAQTALAREQFQLEIDLLNPLRNEELLRGQKIVVMNQEIVLLREQNEVLGTTQERLNAIIKKEAERQQLIKAGQPTQESIGRGIVKAATADIQRGLEPFRREVRDAQKQVDVGAASPNQLPETNRLRRIELIEKTIRLLEEERRVGVISHEEFNRQFLLQDANLRTETNKSQRGFLEGWQDAFKQFSDDSAGAFGLAQTLARNFVSSLQSFATNAAGTAIDAMTDKTIRFRDVLQTIPDLLKQIAQQLIGMAIAQGVASAIGGGLGGLFGGTQAGSGAIAGPRPASGNFFPQLGFATGGSFVVGGPGGTDQTPVGFWATRGERVTVETPGQQRMSNGGMIVNVFNNNSSAVKTEQSPDNKSLNIYIDKRIEQSLARGQGKKIVAREFGKPISGRVG